MWRAKQKEWDDIIITDESPSKPIAFISNDEIMSSRERDLSGFFLQMWRLERRVRFWRDVAIVASVLCVFLVGWLLAFISWAW